MRTIDEIKTAFPGLTPHEANFIPHLIEALYDPVYNSQASFVAVAAENYADNDVVSDDADEGEGSALEFTEAIRVSGGSGKLIGGTISFSEDGILATSALHLFSQAPTASELDDNAAFALGAADQPYYLGSIAFPAAADVGSISFSRSTAVTPAAPVLVRSATRSLYGILQFTDAEENEAAGMTVDITLYFE